MPVSQPLAGPPALGERWSGQHGVGRGPDSDDLARNAPGASASARARELRREHPLLTSAAAVLGIRTSARSFAAGARGERTVGRQLSKWAARYGWYVLHAVPAVLVPFPKTCLKAQRYSWPLNPKIFVLAS